MSISIIAQPASNILGGERFYAAPACNDIYTTVSGNTFGGANVFEYKYIADVYVNGQLSVTLKSFPDPQYGFGVFNLKNIVSSFLGTDFFAEETTPTQIWRKCPNSSARVFMQFGEEYLSGNTFVKNTNLVSGTTGVLFNGSLGFVDEVNKSISNYFPTASSFTTLFLDNKISERVFAVSSAWKFNTYKNQRKFLYYLNREQAPPTNTAVAGFFLLRTFNAAGTTIGTYTFSNTFPASGSTDVSCIEIGYPQIAAASGFTVGPLSPATIFGHGEVGYRISLFGFLGLSGWVDVFVFFFDDCGRTASTAYTVHWLNEFGGFNSWLFNKKNEISQRKDQQAYKKTYGTLGSDGSFTVKTYDRNQQVFYTVLQDSIVMNTDLLTDTDVLYLKSLFSSPLIFLEDQNGVIISASVDQDNYRINRKVNQKLFALELTIKPSYNDFRQIL